MVRGANGTSRQANHAISFKRAQLVSVEHVHEREAVVTATEFVDAIRFNIELISNNLTFNIALAILHKMETMIARKCTAGVRVETVRKVEP